MGMVWYLKPMDELEIKERKVKIFSPQRK